MKTEDHRYINWANELDYELAGLDAHFAKWLSEEKEAPTEPK